MITQKTLDNYQAKILPTGTLNELECSLPAWDVPRVRTTFRVCKLNGGDFAVALPGLGGNFRNSYRWVMSFTPGLNRQQLTEIMSARQGMDWACRHTTQTAVICELIYRAVKMIEKGDSR